MNDNANQMKVIRKFLKISVEIAQVYYKHLASKICLKIDVG